MGAINYYYDTQHALGPGFYHSFINTTIYQIRIDLFRD